MINGLSQSGLAPIIRPKHETSSRGGAPSPRLGSRSVRMLMLGDANYFNVLRNGVTLVSHPINRLQGPDDKSQNACWQVAECEIVNCSAGALGERVAEDERGGG